MIYYLTNIGSHKKIISAFYRHLHRKKHYLLSRAQATLKVLKHINPFTPGNVF